MFGWRKDDLLTILLVFVDVCEFIYFVCESIPTRLNPKFNLPGQLVSLKILFFIQNFMYKHKILIKNFKQPTSDELKITDTV